jgi:hypothetical protein
MKNQPLAPPELKNLLKPATPKHNYSLRQSTLAIVENKDVIRSKYGEWSFGSFFTKFYSSINNNRQLFFITNFRDFKIFFRVYCIDKPKPIIVALKSVFRTKNFQKFLVC